MPSYSPDGGVPSCSLRGGLRPFLEPSHELSQRDPEHPANLAQFEKVKRFALLPKDMTIEGGELTPTMKIRRRVVEQHWASVIEQLYAREPAPTPS